MKKSKIKYTYLLLPILLTPVFLVGCSSNAYAPIVNAQPQLNPQSGFYRVKPGDTLYSIAWSFGLDYRALAVANNLNYPYKIRPNQRLRIRLLAQTQTKKKHHTFIAQWHSRPIKHWDWPARGRIVNRFHSSVGGNKGINIAGRYGEPIRAAANGIVVYSGAGVRGYGNLIIVKHNNSYLSAYAFNKRNLVTKGTRVHAGQRIAEMGRDNSGTVMLHFEIRRDGKPINPLQYLS